MKNILFPILVLLPCGACFPQDHFRDFITGFNPVILPIETISNLSSQDSLSGKQTNEILINGQDYKPQYVDKTGAIKPIKQYYGLYPEVPDSFLKDVKGEDGKWLEKRFIFYPRILPIGKLTLNEKFETIIIKVIAFETTFYDLWNFSKDGKALSVVCLFWGMRDAGPRDEKVTFTIVDSKITKEGDIIWHENADGLETFRTYRLNPEGLFQIVKEEKKGETEF